MKLPGARWTILRLIPLEMKISLMFSDLAVVPKLNQRSSLPAVKYRGGVADITID